MDTLRGRMKSPTEAREDNSDGLPNVLGCSHLLFSGPTYPLVASLARSSAPGPV
jgi:hypothetical protein